MADAKKSIKDTAAEIAEAGLAQLESAADVVREKAGPVLAEARDKAAESLAEAREKAGPMLAEARDKAAESLAEAREKAGPILAEAVDKAAETLADAREKAAPILAEAREKAAEAASQAADLAVTGKELAVAKAAELRTDVAAEQEKSGGRWKKFLLFGGIAALGAVAYRRLRGGGADDNWESSYTPAPRATTAGVTPVMDAEDAVAADGAGASPDEAAADAAESPHEVTTPEEPAEVVDLDAARKADET